MTLYRFTIQNNIEILIDSGSREEARQRLVEHPTSYCRKMCENAVISFGSEVD